MGERSTCTSPRRRTSGLLWGLVTVLGIAVLGITGSVRDAGADDVELTAGEIVLSEIHYHPESNGASEFIELHNPGAGPVDLSGWEVTDAIEVDLSGLVIPPDGHLVIARDANTFRVLWGRQPDAVFARSLSNGGETISLVSPDGVAESVTWDDRLPWPAEADGEGASLQRLAADLDSGRASSWFAGAPSPGSAAAAPVSVVFSHERGFHNQPFQLTLSATQPNATLWYQLDDSPQRLYTGPIPIGADGGVHSVAAWVVRSRGVRSAPTVHSFVNTAPAETPTVVLRRLGTGVAGQFEDEVSVEFIAGANNDISSFGVRAGAAASQGGAHAGKSTKLFFRSDYGTSRLRADLFRGVFDGANATTSHDQLFLRAEHDDPTLLRQLMAHDALLAMGQLAPHGRLVRFFDNGTDAGLRHLQERPESGFMESYSELDEDLWQAFSATDFPILAAAVPTVNDLVQRVDQESFFDFLINQWFAAVPDFATNQNWRAAGPGSQQVDDTHRWHFFNWDLDAGYGAATDARGWFGYRSPAGLWDLAITRASLEDRFAARATCALFGPDAPLGADSFLARVADRVAEAESVGLDVADFDDAMTQWLPARQVALIDRFRGDSLLSEIDPVRLVDSVVAPSTTVSALGRPGVETWYTLNGSDPRGANGSPAPQAHRFHGSFVPPVGEHEIVARHRVIELDGSSTWSDACNEPTALTVDPDLGELPASVATSCLSGRGRLDVELYNNGGRTHEFAVVVGHLSPRLRSVAPGDRATASVTGRPDGPLAVKVLRSGSPILNRTIDVSCSPVTVEPDPPVSESPQNRPPPTQTVDVADSCLAERGRIDVTLGSLATDAIGEVRVGSLAPRITVVPAAGTARITVTGRPDGPLTVVALLDGRTVADVIVDIDCDPSPPPVPAPEPEPEPPGGSDSEGEVSIAVSCIAGNGRVDVVVAHPATRPGPAAASVNFGRLVRGGAIAEGADRRFTVTGRPDGPLVIRVSIDGAQVLTATRQIACDN